MTRTFRFGIDEFYHVYNRGVDKRIIFDEEIDKKRFLKLLYLCNGSKMVNLRELPKGETFGLDMGGKIVNVCAYCLMDNHFHLLLQERIEGGISKFMQKLVTAYVMYYNEKNKRTGTLFEGPFSARHVDEDTYLRHLLSYIHLNPVDMIESGWKENGINDLEKAKNYLEQYQYSSFKEFSKQEKARPESAIINKSAMPEYFASLHEFDDYLNDWLTMPKDFLRKFD